MFGPRQFCYATSRPTPPNPFPYDGEGASIRREPNRGRSGLLNNVSVLEWPPLEESVSKIVGFSEYYCHAEAALPYLSAARILEDNNRLV